MQCKTCVAENMTKTERILSIRVSEHQNTKKDIKKCTGYECKFRPYLRISREDYVFT